MLRKANIKDAAAIANLINKQWATWLSSLGILAMPEKR